MKVIFDERLQRFKDAETGRMVDPVTVAVPDLLHYSIIRNLRPQEAQLLLPKVEGILSSSHDSGLEAQVLRGRLAMAESDLREILKREREENVPSYFDGIVGKSIVGSMSPP